MNINTIALCLLILASDNIAQLFRQDPDRFGVNTHVYEFRQIKETPAPSGFKPVYISHFGRHGSRTDWNAGHYKYVIDILERADSLNILSARGDSLLNASRQVLVVHGGQDGHLTPLGEAEQGKLARRLYKRYPSVFRNGSKHVRVESSTVPRCLVSMASFTNSLAAIQPDIKFSISSDAGIFAIIHNNYTPGIRAASQVLLDSLIHNTVNDTVEVYNSLFTDSKLAKKLAPDADKFQKYIWYVARIAKSSGLSENVYRYIPYDVSLRWWDYFNRELYIRNCNSVEFGDERMVLTEPLVKDIIDKADAALADGTVCADLKFSHDYPLLACASYFGLSGVGERMSFDEIPARWNDPMNVPLSGNFQLVFYRNKAGELLVKFVYGDIERKVIGLEAYSGYYYLWNDFKEYCRKRSANLGSNLSFER